MCATRIRPMQLPDLDGESAPGRDQCIIRRRPAGSGRLAPAPHDSMRLPENLRQYRGLANSLRTRPGCWRAAAVAQRPDFLQMTVPGDRADQPYEPQSPRDEGCDPVESPDDGKTRYFI